MKYAPAASLTYSDLHAHPEAVIYSEVIHQPTGAEGGRIVAGIKKKDPENSSMWAYYCVDYHHGFQSWVFSEESSTVPLSQRFRKSDLQGAIEMFESRTGSLLPDQLVVEPGEGVWLAKAPRQRINPWVLEEGGQYRCLNKEKRLKEFTARAGGPEGLTLVISGSEDGSEVERHPSLYLGKEDWRTMRKITPGFPNGKLLFDINNEQAIENLRINLRSPSLGEFIDALSPRARERLQGSGPKMI